MVYSHYASPALIEKIRRISARIAIDKVDINLADYCTGKMFDTTEKAPKNLILVIADMARSKHPRLWVHLFLN